VEGRLTTEPASHQPPSTTAALGSTTCFACGESCSVEHIAVPDHEYGVPHVAKYVCCAGCGSIFQSPMPDEAQLAAFYPATYHSFGTKSWISDIRHDMRARRIGALAKGEGAVLDHGCGDGAFLLRAANRLKNAQFYGYELDSQRRLETLAGGRVTLVKGSLDDLMDVLPDCQLITMNHVIEHLPNPLATLTRLCKKLAPGGVFEGQTPAAGSLEHRVFGRRWSGYHAPRHTVVFSRAGLSRLLERAGLVEIEIDGAFNPAGIAVSLASLRQAAEEPGIIARRGMGWLSWLGLAGALAPIDLLSGSPGIVNFSARRASAA
jgi:SAM-dependent methyltransferase